MIIVDPWHWMTEDGEIPDIPKLRNNLLRVATLIEYGGPLPVMHGRETLVPCRRRPNGKACTWLLFVVKEEDHHLFAYCPECRSEEYLISNWQSTPWAEGQMEPVPMKRETVH